MANFTTRHTCNTWDSGGSQSYDLDTQYLKIFDKNIITLSLDYKSKQ
jgi:hypothetical protein